MLGIDFTQITNMLPQIQEMGQQFLKAAEAIRDSQKEILNNQKEILTRLKEQEEIIYFIHRKLYGLPEGESVINSEK